MTAEMETPNGVNSSPSLPRTPSIRTLSLTEYATNPSPSREGRKEGKARVTSVVPLDFLLPTGYPDVGLYKVSSCEEANTKQYLRLILTSRVYEVVDETPLTHATNLSNRLECQVLLKREDLQPVFSFKLRGAYNKMAHLDPQTRWKGVVACSAGTTTTTVNMNKALI
jgi:threonine dehydratase